MGKLEGKIVLVTGAAQGQGAAACRLFVEEGAVVIVADVIDDLGAKVAEDLGDAALYVHLDVSIEADWSRAVSTAIARFGGLDTLINNAGIHWTRAIEEESASDVQRLLAVNLMGPFYGIQAVVPAMRSRGGGSIVNIASTAAITSYPGHGAYSMSKWGLRGLTRTAAIELAPDRIRVNCVAPGAVESAMTPALEPNAPKDASGLRRRASPNEIARVTAFLCSDESSFVTGTDLIADGGHLLSW